MPEDFGGGEGRESFREIKSCWMWRSLSGGRWVVSGGCSILCRVLLNLHQTGAQLYLILSADIFPCIKECRIVWSCRESSLSQLSAEYWNNSSSVVWGLRWCEVVWGGQKIGLFSIWNGHLGQLEEKKERARNNGRVYQVLLSLCI